MTPTEIKAELHDLQTHTCNGKMTVNPDGSMDVRLCSRCARIRELEAMFAAAKEPAR